MLSRRLTLMLGAGFLATPAWAAGGKINVAFAGSMGVVMDRGIGPAFTRETGVKFQGMGQAAMALAHLLISKSINSDVFVSVSAEPVKLLEQAGLVTQAVPVASTAMVLAYAPKGKFAASFAAGKTPWYEVLQSPGLRFGRTDPATDPQGQYALYTLQLAELYYRQPELATKITGKEQNPAQIFSEPSLLVRLQEGQIDATLGYESAVKSLHLPFLALPDEMNMSNPADMAAWYSKAALHMTVKGHAKTLHPGPLVFYAAALKNAVNPQGAQAFIDFMASPQGQALFARYGYASGRGPAV